MRDGVTALNVANNKRNVAIAQRDALNKQVMGQEEYAIKVADLGLDTSPFSHTAIDQSGPTGLGDHLFNPRHYSKEELASIGFKIPEQKRELGIGVKYTPWERALTYNEVAKLNGYENAEDALNKGFEFDDPTVTLKGGGNMLRRYNSMKNEVIVNSKMDTNMSIQATGSPLISQGISETFSGGIGDVKYFDPVFNTWGTTPGFTDKGEIEPGTKLNFANVDATLAKNGNLTYMRVPYSWENADGDTETGTLNLQFNNSTKAKATRFIQHGINQTMLRRDDAEKTANDFFKEMKYDALVGDNIGNIWDNIQVVEGGQRLPLNIIDLGGGVEIHTFKQHFAGSSKPKVVAERINKATGKIEKTTYSDDVLDYKKWYAEDVNMSGR